MHERMEGARPRDRRDDRKRGRRWLCSSVESTPLFSRLLCLASAVLFSKVGSSSFVGKPATHRPDNGTKIPNNADFGFCTFGPKFERAMYCTS